MSATGNLCQARKLAILPLILVFTALWFPSDAQAQLTARLKAVNGAWETRCETPPGAPSEQCYLSQYVTAQDREYVGLFVSFLRSADDSDVFYLRVLAPLGVLLTSQLGVHVDETSLGRMPFIRCVKAGCLSETQLSDELMKQFLAGKTANFSLFLTPEEGLAIPIDLDGLAKAMQTIAK